MFLQYIHILHKTIFIQNNIDVLHNIHDIDNFFAPHRQPFTLSFGKEFNASLFVLIKIGYCMLCLDNLKEFQSEFQSGFHNPTGTVICSTHMYAHAQLVSLGPALL